MTWIRSVVSLKQICQLKKFENTNESLSLRMFETFSTETARAWNARNLRRKHQH